METIVVTRHTALVDYLQEIGLVPAGVSVVAHATPEIVKGKHVIGVLPFHLAALAACVTVVTLNLPAEKRGVELSLEDVRKFADKPVTYQVTKLDD